MHLRTRIARAAFASGTRAALPAVLVLLFVSLPAGAATVRGVVRSVDGTPVGGARVQLVEALRSVHSGADGAYAFDDVAPGAYHVQASRPGIGSVVAELEIGTETGEAIVDLVLEVSEHREQIIVTASRGGRGTDEAVQPVRVVDAAELNRRMAPTLGETLSTEAGIASSGFGPGASRPVIRGQGAGRVRIVESGLGVGDASSTSPDHAVASDPLGVEQVEILRGPATLLYGSSAVGGLVNLLDRRIPDFVPSRPLTGTARARLGSADDERSGALELNGGSGSFAWHLDALSRSTDDVAIRGRGVAGDPGSPVGILPNSATESDGGAIGGAWVRDGGFAGAAIRGLDTLYGIPAAPGDEAIRIELRQRRADVRGAFDVDLGRFDRVRFAAAGTDYEHRELEGDEVGTIFRTDGREARAEMLHGSGSPHAGILGVQYVSRDVEAIGDEAFLPPSETESAAVFVLQEIERGPTRYELGARFESQSVRTDDPALPDRDHDGLSISAGLAWRPDERTVLGVSLASAARLPSAEELLSDGAHPATRSFEVGDPGLVRERSRSIDVTVRRRVGRVTGRATAFLTRYDGFIAASPTGAVRDGLPEFRFEQRDAEFRGFELESAIHVVSRDGHHLDVRLRTDAVRAELRATDEPLPRIPPFRAGVGLTYRGPHLEASVEARRTARQDRIAPFETETPGHTEIAADVGLRLVRGGTVHHVLLRGTNLGDRVIRNHVSRLKDVAPGPGRGVSLSYRIDF